MHNIDVVTGGTPPITLAGKTYSIRQLKTREWGALQAWLKAAVPSPVTLAIRSLAEASASGSVPQAVQDSLFRQAQDESRRWPPRIGSVAWVNAIDDIDGGRIQFVKVAIAAGGMEIDDDEAERIVEDMTRDEFAAMVMACLVGEPDIPKAGGAALPPTTTPMTGDGSSSIFGPSLGLESSSSAS